MDFIVGNMEIAIEAKATQRIHRDHLHGLRELAKDQPKCTQRVVVALEEKPRLTDDGILILPATTFVERLWAGELVTAE